MASLVKGRVWVISFSVVLVVVLLWLPRHGSAPHQIPSENLPPDTEFRIDSALGMIAGSEPMPGILLLRSIAEEHPENFRAQFHLGMFSVQTGQWQKAYDRFRIAQKIDASNPEVLYWIGVCAAELKLLDEAKANLGAYIESSNSDQLKRDKADSILNLLIE